jgi:hypothetical protein
MFSTAHPSCISHFAPQLTRGRILHDLVEIEQTMANVEDKNDERLQTMAKGGKVEAAGNSTVVQVIGDGDH